MSYSLYFVLPIVDKQTHRESTADIGQGISELRVNTDAEASFIVNNIIHIIVNSLLNGLAITGTQWPKVPAWALLLKIVHVYYLIWALRGF